MGSSSRKRGGSRGQKVRVPFRRNRSQRPRGIDWTRAVREAEGHEVDAERSESVTGKGPLSRRRTIIVHASSGQPLESLRPGLVVAMRGLYAEVDDGDRVWTCTVRRVLRTRLIEERHPITVGDHVRFRIASEEAKRVREGVIEAVESRTGQLRRWVGKRIHTIVANVEQAIIVSSADQPPPKPRLIDRYLVAAHAGEIIPIVCMNKADLDRDGLGKELLDHYATLGYTTLYTSAVRGDGIDLLRNALTDRSSVIAGQSGVGKSSLLNLVQPGLRLKTGDIVEQTRKGRHTTTTARLLRLQTGGYVVDTPGVRSFDLSAVGRHELEACFVEFLDHIPHCKFADCTHIHESDCAVQRAVESGLIDPQRYESYVRLFSAPSDAAPRLHQSP